MAKYKKCDYNQTVLLPLSLSDQLQPGTLEFYINMIVEEKIDLSVFDTKYNNDDTGSPAYDPKILLKIILLAYSRGLTSSRRIEQACMENVIFMSLACGMAPDHSTIAHFVADMKKEIISIFRDVLLYCEDQNLLGGTHFSLDGCKLPSNASKGWSGTFTELHHKQKKLEKKVRKLIHDHENHDRQSNKGKNQTKRIDQQIKRIDIFLRENKPKQGKTKKEIQSNITDNESAKMPTSHGVIQGYNAQALVDEKHQIIVHAEAMSNGQDHDNLSPMLDGAKENMKAIGKGNDYFSGKELSADANYHSSTNLQKCEDEKIDAYIPDTGFRKRDERYKNQSRFKDGVTKPPKKKVGPAKPEIFSWEEFEYDDEAGKYKCPNGKYLNQQSLNHKVRNKVYHYYRAREADCRECLLRSKCLARKNGKARALLIPLGYIEDKEKRLNLSQKMKEKIDSTEGKAIYSKRLATVEPVFANIRSQKRMDRFTYRSKVKVNVQWMLYCLVHNIEKMAHYGYAG